MERRCRISRDSGYCRFVNFCRPGNATSTRYRIVRACGEHIVVGYRSSSPYLRISRYWARGNAGEELNRSEAVIYSALIRDINNFAFQRRYSASLVDDQNPFTAASWDLAGFLYENPGARKEWESLRDMYRRHREPHTSGEYRNSFEEAVRADLEVLDRTYGP